MRISQLSEQTGVSVATLKYYLREGLLPAGDPVSATSSEYAAAHIERVRLVRAMVETAGLSIASVRQVTRALDDPPESRAELLSVAARALPAPHADHPVSAVVEDLVTTLGWELPPGHSAMRWLSAAISAARSAGVPFPRPMLLGYAEAALQVARLDVGEVRDERPEEALRLVVAGTVLGDPIFAAMRRMAQAHVAWTTTHRSDTE